MRCGGFWLILLSGGLMFTVGCHGNQSPQDALASATIDESASPLFTDITAGAGISFRHEVGPERQYFFPEIMSPGGALLDFDQDGDLDVYLINSGSPPPALHAGPMQPSSLAVNRLFRQETDGRFSDVTDTAGLGDPSYGVGVAVGDVNNDGYPDVYVTNYGPDRLFLNRGNGTFEDVTERAGIHHVRWSTSAAFFDFDRDGWLDLFVTNYVDYQPFQPCFTGTGRPDYCNPAVFPRTPDTLYHNLTGRLAAAQSSAAREKRQDSVRFADVSLKSGIAEKMGAGLGVVCADFTGDGWSDVYVANDGHANHLWVNQQNGTFRDEAVLMGVAYDALGRGQGSMGIALGDLNHDDAFDLLVTNLEGESNALYLSITGGGFQDASLPAGLSEASLPMTGFGTALIDIELDSDLDLVIANGRVRRSLSRSEGLVTTDEFWLDYVEPNQLFLNDGSGQFQEYRSRTDPLVGQRDVSRGLAYGDIDNDGDLDLLLTNTAGPPRLLRNDSPRKGHWISVRAVDPSHGGRDEYGARVSVYAGGRSFPGLVNPGSSYLSSHDPRVHFGLGDAAMIEKFEVRWPDGVQEVFLGTGVDQSVTLVRGEGAAP